MRSRRQFMKLSLGLAAGARFGLPRGAQLGSSTSKPAVLFEGYAVPPRREVQEAVITQLKGGRYWLLFGENRKMVGKFSSDHGRTWGETTALRAADGKGIGLCRNTAHHSLFR